MEEKPKCFGTLNHIIKTIYCPFLVECLELYIISEVFNSNEKK